MPNWRACVKLDENFSFTKLVVLYLHLLNVKRVTSLLAEAKWVAVYFSGVKRVDPRSNIGAVLVIVGE